MKKIFNMPAVEVVAFQVEDIICVSGSFSGEGGSGFGDGSSSGGSGSSGGGNQGGGTGSGSETVLPWQPL